jgi:methionine-S-sulfoxide reductase
MKKAIRSDKEREESAKPKKTEIATFAAGCFWGVEDKFRKVKGVISTRVGYTGGQIKNPTYEMVCSDKTGHAESVEVVFDPSVISYSGLLGYFFLFHDPTQINRQGHDVGTQYRSAIFFRGDKQKDAALKTIKSLENSGKYDKPIATQVVPASEFYPAEEYHQQYFEKLQRSLDGDKL